MAAMTETLRADPAWLIGAVPSGVVCVRGGTQVEVGVDLRLDGRLALVEALASTATAEAVAGAAESTVEEATELLETLRERGVLATAPEARDGLEGLPLAEAILRVAVGDSLQLAWTATEALVLPAGVDALSARRAVRGFVAGLAPHGRLQAYAEVARLRRRSVAGDRPDPEALGEALARARAGDPGAAHVAEIGGTRVWSSAVEELGALGGEHPRRLGPLQRVVELPAAPPLHGRRHSFVAEYAVPNLRYPLRREVRVGRGTTPSAAEAELIARAEAAERYGAGDVQPSALRRAARRDLEAALDPERLHRLTPRQYEAHEDLVPAGPDDRLLWTRGHTVAGEERWAPADAVYLVHPDPERLPALSSSSSGLAAGAGPDDAADRAMRELIERDAFLWTWVQRVARERIDPAGLPADSRDLAGEIEKLGFGVKLVNLTLETQPVVLAAAHREDRLHVACSCREDPALAAAKALNEIGLVLSLHATRAAPDLRPEDVRTPEDHMWLHQRAAIASQAAFLLGSDDVIDLEEVAWAPGRPGEALEQIGEPVVVDLTSPRTSPFHVVRALVPGLVPMSFGWDREPLGMPRLAEPKLTADGRRLGAHLDLAESAPILPHPFP
jgi:thiazole/oxazole-forming peptide maturase SagD family component